MPIQSAILATPDRFDDAEGECPENGGMTPLEVRSVGSIAGWGNTDAMGVAVDCDRR
jgi:hypothetical protein